MGTTLTGTTPQDTYDSLIKVTDNGPIGTSLKTLTDGLGNDSALALSSRGLKVNQSATLITDTATLCHFSNNYLYLRGGSAGLSIADDAFSNSITLVDAGPITFEAGSTERMRITSAGNVGIGTSSPAAKLDINQTNQSGANDFIRLTTAATSGSLSLGVYPSSGNSFSFIGSNAIYSSGGITRLNSGAGGSLIALNTSEAIFYISSGATNPVERARFTANGLTFNADTAAANALDDYEEGTFTPTFNGTTATGGTVSGNYTKIGRVVYVNIRIDGVTFSGSTGAAIISSLPFTVASGFVYSNFSCNYQNCVDGSSTGGFFIVNTTQMRFHDLASINAATFIDGSGREAILSGFYFV